MPTCAFVACDVADTCGLAGGCVARRFPPPPPTKKKPTTRRRRRRPADREARFTTDYDPTEPPEDD